VDAGAKGGSADGGGADDASSGVGTTTEDGEETAVLAETRAEAAEEEAQSAASQRRLPGTAQPVAGPPRGARPPARCRPGDRWPAQAAAATGGCGRGRRRRCGCLVRGGVEEAAAGVLLVAGELEYGCDARVSV
jgi:hypothetical protein